MTFLNEIASFDFLRNAAIAIIFMSITCSIIGAYIVVKRLVFLSGGLTHASFGGVGMAYYFGINPLYGALGFSILSALGFDFLTRKDKLRNDSAIGVLWALGMAIGILFVFMTPGYAPNLMSFLFGNILTITDDLLIANSILALVLLLIFTFAERAITFVAFDDDFAKTRGVSTRLIENIMLIFIAITIVLTLKLVGIMLLVSLLTIPSMISSLFVFTLRRIVWLNIAVTLISGIIGLWLSVQIDIPTGTSIIITLSLIYLISKLSVIIIKKYKIQS